MKKITLVSLNHYCKLALRGGLFLFAIYLYITQWRSTPRLLRLLHWQLDSLPLCQ